MKYSRSYAHEYIHCPNNIITIFFRERSQLKFCVFSGWILYWFCNAGRCLAMKFSFYSVN